MSKVAFFDIDGTLTSENVWKGLMSYFKTHRIRRWVHFLFMFVHYPIYFLFLIGLVDEDSFRSLWTKNLPWYFRGYSAESAEDIWRWVTDSYLKPYWREDILAIARKHKEHGDFVVLVSGGPLPLVAYIARKIGADVAVGTRVEIVDGIYTGKSILPVCIGIHKRSLALQALEERQIAVDLSKSYAYADSKTDIPLLEMAGNPVAVYPRKELEEYALTKNWTIIQ